MKSKIIWPIIISLIIIAYGIFSLWSKSNGWDFSKEGLSFFLEEFKTYAIACGVVWVQFLLSVDRAKKEIRDECEKQYKKRLMKVGSALAEDVSIFLATAVSLFAETSKAPPRLQLDIIKTELPNKWTVSNRFREAMKSIHQHAQEYISKTNAILTEEGLPKGERSEFITIIEEENSSLLPDMEQEYLEGLQEKRNNP